MNKITASPLADILHKLKYNGKIYEPKVTSIISFQLYNIS